MRLGTKRVLVGLALTNWGEAVGEVGGGDGCDPEIPRETLNGPEYTIERGRRSSRFDISTAKHPPKRRPTTSTLTTLSSPLALRPDLFISIRIYAGSSLKTQKGTKSTFSRETTKLSQRSLFTLVVHLQLPYVIS